MRQPNYSVLVAAVGLAGLACGYVLYGVLKPSPKPAGIAVAPTVPHVAFSRPEDRGDLLAGKPPQELLAILASTADTVTMRKAAKALGDLSQIEPLDALQQQLLRNVVFKYLKLARNPDPSVRSEGRLQIQRLWKAAAAALYEAVENEEPRLREGAVAALLTMVDDATVRRLIEIANETKVIDARTLIWASLNNMVQETPTLVPDRPAVSVADRKRLYDDLVRPAMLRAGIQPQHSSAAGSALNANVIPSPV